MRKRFDTTRDDPATREQRLAVLNRSKIFAGIPAARLEALMRRSATSICPPGSVLFGRGDAPQQVLLIGSGVVQLRVGSDPDGAGPFVGVEDTDQQTGTPLLHLQLLSRGDIVGDAELVALTAGQPGSLRRESAAVVLGEPALIMAIDQDALARVLEQEPTARLRLAGEVVVRMRRMQRLLDEALLFKQRGKVRLARFLLEFFEALGRARGGALEIPHPLSQEDVADALGLTRRSVFDDIRSLEDFGAIDHERSGRMVLLDRRKLERIAWPDLSEDRDDGAQSWASDVGAALAAGDALQARELAREALLYHPRHEGLRHRAVLAALRANAWEEAEALITKFGFSTEHPDEDIGALVPRTLKDRAFASLTVEDMQSLALKSAEAYHAIYLRTGGIYSGVNAASMFRVAGREVDAAMIASKVTRQLPDNVQGYWQLATRTEALLVLGQDAAASAAAQAAVKAADAEDGKLASTLRQLRRLARHMEAPAAVLDLFKPRPVLVVAGEVDKQLRKEFHIAAEAAGEAYIAVTDEEAFSKLRLPEQSDQRLALVLPAPLETLLRSKFIRDSGAGVAALIAEHACHLADPRTGSVTAERMRHTWRRALGLGLLAASLREAQVMLAPSLSASFGRVSFHPANLDIAMDLPGWAISDNLTGGYSALLWADALADRELPTLAPLAKPTARAEFQGGTLLSFVLLSDAVRVALDLRTASLRLGRGLKLCLDVEPLGASALANAQLPKLRPATPPNEIYATEAAAAEMALLHPALADLRPVGRVRSDKRLNRIPLWALTRCAF